MACDLCVQGRQLSSCAELWLLLGTFGCAALLGDAATPEWHV